MVALSLVVLLLSAEPQPEDTHPFARRGFIVLSVSAAAFIAGGIFLGVSVSQTNAAGKLEPEPRDALLFVATNNRVGGTLLLVTGALTAGIAAFLFGYEPMHRTVISFTPTPGGAFLGLTWTGL